MKRKGQQSAIIYIMIALVLFVIIFLGFKYFGSISEKAEDAEISNLQRSINTKVQQQNARILGSYSNASFSVPPSVERICFSDADALGSGFGLPDDEVNNLFLLHRDKIIPYRLKDLDLDESQICGRPKNGKITIMFRTTRNGTNIEISEDQEDEGCVSILENGPPEKKIDIVFVPYGYKSKESYTREANRLINSIFLQFEPFASESDKFNFYLASGSGVKCTVDGYIECNDFSVMKSASECPHEHVIVMVDRSVLQDFILPVRSSASGNMVKINTADKPFVLVHEFGHSFGDLADEYVDERYYSMGNFDVEDYPNCDYSGCTEWSSINGTGCYSGCSLKRFFRPTRDSVMRDLDSQTYGPVNEKRISERLGRYE